MSTQEILVAIYTWATVALALIAGLTGFVAYRQLRAIRAGQEWDRGQAIMQELRSPERITLLEDLYSIDDTNPNKLTNHSKITEFRIFVSRLEWIAIMVRRGQMNLDLVMQLIPAIPLRVWYIMGDYIESESEMRGAYGHNFRWLVKKVLVYYICKVPRTEWPRLAPPVRKESVDLVPCLSEKMGLVSSNEFRWALRVRLFKAAFRRALRMKKDEWHKLRRGNIL